MRQEQTLLSFQTPGGRMLDITREVMSWCKQTGIETGLLTLFVQHTSASLTIQENADPDVQADLVDALERMAPSDPRLYRHTLEGPDDMPAHIKAAITSTSLTIPVNGGQPALGTWQGIYIIEHRARSHQRRVIAHLAGH